VPELPWLNRLALLCANNLLRVSNHNGILHAYLGAWSVQDGFEELRSCFHFRPPIWASWILGSIFVPPFSALIEVLASGVEDERAWWVSDDHVPSIIK
jgi:hypothetical protein